MEKLPSPLRVIFVSLREWWSEFYIMGLLNFLYLLLLLPVITAAPATYALFNQARALAQHEGVSITDFFRDMQIHFLRAWQLGAITIFGSLVVVADISFYGQLARQFGPISGVVLYAAVIWVQFIAHAWAMTTARPDLRLREHLRNAWLFTLRFPGHHLALAIFLVLVSSLLVTVAFLSFGLACIVAQVSLLDRAPELVGRPLDYVDPDTTERSVYDDIDRQEQERTAQERESARRERERRLAWLHNLN